MMKKLLQLAVFVMVALFSFTAAFAANSVVNSNDVTVEYIKVNGDTYVSGDTLRVDLGERLDIRVKLQASADVSDVEVRARLIGYEYSNRESTTDASQIFDLQSGDTQYINLGLQVPVRADKDVYELRVDVDGRRVNFESAGFTVRVSGPRNHVLIRDVIFSPSNTVVAGRALLTSVRLENIGERDQDDVKVTVRIPELNLQGAVYVDSVDGENRLGRGEKVTSEEVYLRIPECARGTYDVEIVVTFNEYDSVKTTRQIYVSASELCGQTQPTTPTNPTTPTTSVERTVITAPSAQQVEIGGTAASFPIVIQNTASVAKSYMVSVSGTAGWAKATISDINPVVPAGSSKIVYVTIEPDAKASVGQKVFAIEVSTGDAKQTIIAQANLVDNEPNKTSSGWLTALYIIVVVLVIILIIIGIVAIIAKMSSKDEKDDGKAYY
jgi:hypothetical protein